MFQNPTDINSVKKYPFYSDLLNKIYDLRDQYSIMPRISGKSILGRGIFSIPIGNPNNSVLILGGIKGTHWLTSIILLLFCEELLDAYKNNGKIISMNIRKILENRGVIILPCLNPDGFEVALRGLSECKRLDKDINTLYKNNITTWDCNANGVDISRNFETNWDLNKNSDSLYRGKEPFSEPESMCIARICFDYNIKQLLTLDLGKKELLYGYKDYSPPASKLMAEMIVSGSDYKAYKNSNNNCINNWFIKNFRRPSLSINIDKNTNVTNYNDILNLYSELRELLVIAILL